MPTRYEFLTNYLVNLKPFLLDPLVTEIMICPDEQGGYVTFVEKDGDMREVDAKVDEPSLMAMARDIARSQLKREINTERPSLSASLPDESRIAIVVPPASSGGVTMTIRKFRPQRFTMDELIKLGSVSAEVAATIGGAIARKENILISGGNGSGKTTFLNAAAAAYIDHGRRIVCIENDVREIHLDRHRNKTHFVANTHWSVADAVEDALRHRIQTVLIGEIIGAEGMALLNALATGHSGSLATIHAEHASLAIDRLAACAMQAAKGLTYQAIRLRIAQSIHYVVHMENRKVVALNKLGGYEMATDRFELTDAMATMAAMSAAS